MELSEAPLKQIVKRGMKQTEIGMIPEDWELADLASLCATITDGTHYTPHYVPSGVPFYSVENVTGNDFINTKFITPEEHAFLIRRCKPEKGDILLTRIGDLGSTKLIDWQFEASIYVSLALLKIKKGVSVEYLYAYSKSKLFVSSMEKRSLLNAAPKKTNMGDIGGIPIPLPPSISEQHAVATALSDVDALLGSLDALIVKKKAIKQGAMQQLLTGKQRLPGFKEEWEVRRLEEVVEVISGATPRTSDSANWNGDILWCTPTDITGTDGKYIAHTERRITRQGLESCNTRLLPVGSLLLCTRATIGEIKIAVAPISTNQGFKSLICGPAVNNEFLYYKLLTMKAQMVEKAIGSTFLELSRKDTFALELKLPSVPEQTAIATVLSDMDAELAALEARRAKTALLKQGMMQELLTGRTRLF